MLDRLATISGLSPLTAPGRSRSFLLLGGIVGLLSTGTLFYHYQQGNITFLQDPFHYGSAFNFTATTPWPPPLPHIPDIIPTDKDGHTYPPLYPDVTALEYMLPQHDDSLPFPEGPSARFVRFANEQPGVGFNNQLKEVCVNSLIILQCTRAFIRTCLSAPAESLSVSCFYLFPVCSTPK